MSSFGPVAAVGGVWECPDLFPLVFEDEEIWVLLISLNPGAIKNGTGTQYFIGDFDGVSFTPRYATAEPHWLDFGRDNYAGVTFNNEPHGRRIFIGWMSNWQNRGNRPDTAWTNALTVPRKLGLTKRGNELVLTQFPLCTPTHEIIIDTTKNSRSGLTGFIDLGYDPVTKEIFLGDYAVAVQPIDNKVELKVIVDQTSVELFTSDGSHWITMAVFTDPGVSRELHAFG